MNYSVIGHLAWLPVTLTMTIVAPTAASQVVFVDDDAPLGGDGESWETSFRFLRDGLQAAGKDAEVHIGGGTYLPDRDEVDPEGTGDRMASFEVGTGLVLLGGFAGIGAEDPDVRNPTLYPTILSGDLVGDDDDGGSGSRGGGMYNQATQVVVLSCTFEKCEASWGGAVYNDESDASISNSIFDMCMATYSGGAIFNEASHLTLTNCTLMQNSYGGAVTNDNESAATITNCIFWRNLDDLEGPGADVRYSLIVGVEGEGNIEEDPVFVGQGDMRLWPGSPAIDAADNDALPPKITTDRDGACRFVDDPETEDTGQGTPPIVDMGAHEFQPGFCLADVDRDGTVGLGDLIAILSEWDDLCFRCPEDLDRDGRVGIGDLLIVLAAWGPCP